MGHLIVPGSFAVWMQQDVRVRFNNPGINVRPGNSISFASAGALTQRLVQMLRSSRRAPEWSILGT
jgi:hypothetical protein